MNYKFIDNFLRELLKYIFTNHMKISNQKKESLRLFGLVSYEHCIIQIQNKSVSFDKIYPDTENSESKNFLYNLKFEEFLFWKDLMVDLGLIIVTQNADDKTIHPRNTTLTLTMKGAHRAAEHCHGNDATV